MVSNELQMMTGYVPVGVAVDAGWLSVGGPPGVGNTGMGNKGGIKIRLGILDQLLQLCNLANLLERENFVLIIPINCYTCRVVATVFQAPQS
jgi:hypothetical protein